MNKIWVCIENRTLVQEYVMKKKNSRIWWTYRNTLYTFDYAVIENYKQNWIVVELILYVVGMWNLSVFTCWNRFLEKRDGEERTYQNTEAKQDCRWNGTQAWWNLPCLPYSSFLIRHWKSHTSPTYQTPKTSSCWDSLVSRNHSSSASDTLSPPADSAPSPPLVGTRAGFLQHSASSAVSCSRWTQARPWSCCS